MTHKAKSAMMVARLGRKKWQTVRMTSWAEEEFETLSLGDARLERRAVILTEQLA